VSDTRLRETKREALKGSPQARGKLLREQIRSGKLSHAQVTLAAFCRDEAAAQAAGWRHHYVHVNRGDAAFVKDGAFFESQGGTTMRWGRAWTKVWAEPGSGDPSTDTQILEHARKQAKITTWFGELSRWGEAAPLYALYLAAQLAVEEWEKGNEAPVAGQTYDVIASAMRPRLLLKLISAWRDAEDLERRALRNPVGSQIVNLQYNHGSPPRSTLFVLWALGASIFSPEDRETLYPDGIELARQRIGDDSLFSFILPRMSEWALGPNGA